MILKTHDNKMAYHHTPKTGSRTVIGLMALAQNPELFNLHPEWFVTHNRKAVYPEIRNVVRKWQSADAEESEIRFCIIRDPVKRFVSGYTNRILFHRDLSPLPFDEFVSRFEEFRDAEILVREHFMPQVDFIGTDPTYYTHIFNTDESMRVLHWLFESMYARDFPRLQLQQGGNEIDVNVTDQQKAKIRDLFAEDYRIWFDRD